jgi:type VI secretion system secreted protein Hcp
MGLYADNISRDRRGFDNFRKSPNKLTVSFKQVVAIGASQWAAALCPAPARKERAMPNAYYLKIGSGNSQFTGTSRDPHHVGWIKLTAFYWGWDEAAGSTGGGGGSGKPRVTELSVTKPVDRVSPHLMLAAHNGTYFKSAVLEIADARTGRPTLRVNLSDILLKAHTGDGETESFTINFANIEFNYNPIAEDEFEEMVQSMFKAIGMGRAVSRAAHP